MINDNTVMREKDMRHTNTSNSFVEYVKVLYGTILLKDMKYIRYDYSFFFLLSRLLSFLFWLSFSSLLFVLLYYYYIL